MNNYYLQPIVLIVMSLICRAVQANDKYITQIEIAGKDLPQFQQIFIAPYTEGPRRNVQEAPAIMLNGIQDYAVTEKSAGRWKPGQPLTYHLETPVLVNVTTHNPELLVSIKMLDGTGKAWEFKNESTEGKNGIDRFGEHNS